MMKKHVTFVFACALVCSLASSVAATAQTPATPAAQGATDAGITLRYVLGEVTEFNQATNLLTLRTDAGNTIVVAISSTTVYKRIPPGETTLTNAAPIAATELSVGDRVIARGSVNPEKRAAAAREVIVMTRADLTARREREQEEWRRGVVGTVTAINPATKEVTVKPRARGMMGVEPPPVVIAATAPDILFRRYAPDSIRFQDAKTSSFTELKVGDQLRARGERSPDGAHFLPKEIVSGAFRTVVGTVTAVAADGASATVTPTSGGAPVTVRVKSDSTLRRLPEGGMMAMAGGGMGGNRPGGTAANREGEATARPPRGGAAPGAGAMPPGAGGAGGGFGAGRGVDFSEMLERLPALTLAELKPGEMVIVSSTASNDSSQATAIALLAGVERLMNMMQGAPQAGRRNNAGQSLGTGLPGGLELGIGGP